MPEQQNPKKQKKITSTTETITSVIKTGPLEKQIDKMATAGQAKDPQAPVTQAELMAALQTMEKTFLSQIAEMFRPLYNRMESVEKTIKETQQTAKGAYQNSLANHAEIKQIQQAEEILAERTLKLDLSTRQNNLKLRGLQTGTHITTLKKAARDIMITLYDHRFRKKILTFAKKNGHIIHGTKNRSLPRSPP
ncbi:UNVERIFIED_CONTAM: hypothetical protein K2H54_015446 [Gekko kuhli]